MSTITLYPSKASLSDLAKQITEQYGFHFADQKTEHNIQLCLHECGLSLVSTDYPTPLIVDFLSADKHYRQHHPQKELLAKACGLKRGGRLSILDTTAGLGNDAFILAALGAKVVMLERSPVLCALLEDALRRLDATQHSLDFSLMQTDSISYLQDNPNLPFDAIVCDPMYPHRKKSALVKKEMRCLQSLLGPDQDSEVLFKAASALKPKRLVIKRPLQSDTTSLGPPSFQITGKACRFDVYT